MTALAQVVEAVDPALRAHAVSELPGGRYDHLQPELAFVLEAVWEGYLAHYDTPRAFAGMDPDLRLLAGDALFALGLERLAESGDLEAVGVLADLISQTARAEAEGRRDDVAGLWEEHVKQLSGSA